MNIGLRRYAAALVAITWGGSAFAAVPAAHAAYGTVSGVVTGPAGPIEGVTVELFQYDAVMGYWDQERETSTNADGTYSVSAAPGDYRVSFTDGSGAHLDEFFENAPTVHDATTITVPSGGGVTASAILDAAAHITGKLTAPAGTVMGDYRVIAFEEVHEDGDIYFRLAAEDMIDVDGTYDLAGLRGGTYRVQFGDGVAYDQFAVEYYNDKPSRDTAEDLVVAAGGVRSGVDAQLGLPGEISGRLTDGTGAPEDGRVTAFTRVGTEWVAVAETETDYDGTYLLEGLAAGTYRVSFAAYSGGVALVEYWNDKGRLVDADDIVLVAGGEIADINAQLVAGEHAEPAATAPVAAAPVPPAPVPPSVDVPTALATILAGLDVSGKPKVGRTLKVTGLDLVLRTTVSYRFQWFAGTKKIKKATRHKLTTTRAMKGKRLSVKVTATAASTSTSVRLKAGRVR